MSRILQLCVIFFVLASPKYAVGDDQPYWVLGSYSQEDIAQRESERLSALLDVEILTSLFRKRSTLRLVVRTADVDSATIREKTGIEPWQVVLDLEVSAVALDARGAPKDEVVRGQASASDAGVSNVQETAPVESAEADAAVIEPEPVVVPAPAPVDVQSPSLEAPAVETAEVFCDRMPEDDFCQAIRRLAVQRAAFEREFSARCERKSTAVIAICESWRQGEPMLLDPASVKKPALYRRWLSEDS